MHDEVSRSRSVQIRSLGTADNEDRDLPVPGQRL